MRIPTAGDVLDGKYRLDRVLGEGGFGIVFAATTLSTERVVAAKFLKPGASGYDGKHVARFLRELKAIARLQSPHTLTLFDYGQAPDGVLYMICEYIDGQDLSELLLHRDRLTEGEAVHVLYQVALSLAEAHEQGILHRDLKPSNIRLFRYNNDPLRVKLLDFGIALSMSEAQARLTATGNAVGTPRYMSPEQLHGLDLTAASDVYSLGLVMCEMLLGRAATVDAVRLRSEGIAGLSGVSEPLRLFVNRMIAFDAGQRFSSAQEVVVQLRPLMARDGFSSSQTVQLEPAGPRSLPRIVEVRDPTPGWVWGVAVVLACAGAVWWLLSRESSQVVAVAERRVALLSTEQKPVAPKEIEEEVEEPKRDPNHSEGCGGDRAIVRRIRAMDGLASIDMPVFLPLDYDGSRPYPLVLYDNAAPLPVADPLGIGRLMPAPTATGIPVEKFELASAAERGGFIAVALPPVPDRVPQADPSPTASSRTGRTLVTAPPTPNPRAGQILQRSLRAVEENLCVRRDQVFLIVAAPSGANVVAGGLADRIAGLATVDGLPPDSRVVNGVPQIHVGCRERLATGERRQRWLNANGCAGKPEMMTVGDHICTRWSCSVPIVSCERAKLAANPTSVMFDLNACEKLDFPFADTIWAFFESLIARDTAAPDHAPATDAGQRD